MEFNNITQLKGTILLSCVHAFKTSLAEDGTYCQSVKLKFFAFPSYSYSTSEVQCSLNKNLSKFSDEEDPTDRSGVEC